MIPVLDRTSIAFTHSSATAALIPPFYSPTAQLQENVPAKFIDEFHDLGAQVGHDVLPGRGLVILHRGEESNPVVCAMSTSYMLVILAIVLALSLIVFWLLIRSRAVTRVAAWDGGLRHLWPAFTYTATGFSNPVRVVFQVLLRPAAIEDSTEAVVRHFRTAIRREYVEIHIVDRLVLEPPIKVLRNVAAVVRKMHVGHVNAYAAYVLLALLAVLIAGTGLFRL